MSAMTSGAQPALVRHGSVSLPLTFDAGQIDALFSALDRGHAPGAAVGIAIGGRPVYRKGFGLASLELPILLSTTTRLRIASISKQFVALAYALLCEEGRASLDDRIGAHLPELNPVMRDVTMRQLLTHVSGIRDAFDICWQFSGTRTAISSAELLSLYHDIDDVNTAPGRVWSYNGGGYLIASHVIERITGQALDDVLRERIFDRLGMYDTAVRAWDTDFMSHSASLHARNPNGQYEKATMGTALCGEAGLVSTVDDMLRWLIHMNRPVIGKAATWKAMRTPQKLKNGTLTSYGLGLVVDRYRGLETISHVGGLLGGSAHMLKVPEVELDIIVLMNRQDPFAMSLAYQIVDACLPQLPPEPAVAAALPVQGVFRSLSTGRVIQLYSEHGQQRACVNGQEWPCVLDSQGVLRSSPIWSYVRQSAKLVGEGAQSTRLRFDDFGNLDELTPQRPVSESDITADAGTYTSASTHTTLEIGVREGRAVMRAVGRFGSTSYALECLSERLWRAKAMDGVPWWGGIIAFGDGACTFTSGRNNPLMFRRVS